MESKTVQFLVTVKTKLRTKKDHANDHAAIHDRVIKDIKAYIKESEDGFYNVEGKVTSIKQLPNPAVIVDVNGAAVDILRNSGINVRVDER